MRVRSRNRNYLARLEESEGLVENERKEGYVRKGRWGRTGESTAVPGSTEFLEIPEENANEREKSMGRN